MPLPSLPERDENGNRPAAATAQVVLARRIIRAREAQGLSRRELAERSGLAVETLARLESGRQMPRPATIEKLMRVLGEF
ncbi:MAG: helix-turn-helix domain-containing protein [Phycisphaeraceae bacterium]